VSPTQANSARDTRIDTLRGAAALAVVFFHLAAVPMHTPGLADRWWNQLVALGYLGVPVFFVLSGYCIGHSWLRGGRARDFLRRRFWRIFPAYCFSLLFTLGWIMAVWLITGVNNVSPLPLSAGGVAATLTLLTAPATHVHTINWAYWSLTNEIFYYAIMGGLLGLIRPERRGCALVVLHTGLCLLGLTGYDFHGTWLFFTDWWSLFALGILVCLWQTRSPIARWFALVSALHLTALLVLRRTGTHELVALLTAVAIVVPPAWFAPPSGNPLERLGQISYSVYLLHVPVGVYIFQRFARPWAEGSFGRQVLGEFIALIPIIAVAALSYRFIERPLLRPSAARQARSAVP
jgi:peptidoglycan/LPS O-acetylase OafA/YrhL